MRLNQFTELYPDIALLNWGYNCRASGLPGPDVVLLVIEVVDKPFAYDRGEKMPRCAVVGIPEARLVNLPRRTVEVHREPRDGRYQQVTVHRSGERIALLTLPDVAVAVDDILP